VSGHFSRDIFGDVTEVLIQSFLCDALCQVAVAFFFAAMALVFSNGAMRALDASWYDHHFTS